MKRIVKKYYDRVQLSQEKKQDMLSDLIKKESEQHVVNRPTWKLVTIITAVVIAALAIVLPLALLNNGNNNSESSVVMSPSVSVTEPGQVVIAENEKNFITTIVMSLNPDVEIRLDEDGIVTEVVGLNDDGISLVEGIEFTGLSLENATIMVVNQLILQGYITAAEIQEEINISLNGDSIATDILDVMTNIIETAAAAQNITVDVIPGADENAVRIVLEGEGEPDVLPELDQADLEDAADIGLELEFVMKDGTYSAYVDGVLFHGRDGETLECMVDEADMRLNRAALRNIIELIEKGYVTDADEAGAVLFYFNGNISDSAISSLADLTTLIIAEYDLHIAVTVDLDAQEILLVSDETVAHEAQASKYALHDVLNPMVNKDEEDLLPRQIAILKAAYTYREYQRLLEKRYFVVIPDLVGMSEQKAIDILLQLGLAPVVVREKVAGYDPELPGGVPTEQEQNDSGETSTPKQDEDVPQATAEPVPLDDEQDQENEKESELLSGVPEEVTEWEYPVVDFGCVFYQDGPAGYTCQTGMPLQINVIVPEDDTQPEVTDYRDDSGIVIREMDVPFDVSACPDTFSLSGASGFDAIIKDMNGIYTIRDEADYTVTIDKDTGWADTAVITITHRDGFPQYKYFVQSGRIIEVEYQWRRGVPTAEDEAWAAAQQD